MAQFPDVRCGRHDWCTSPLLTGLIVVCELRLFGSPAHIWWRADGLLYMVDTAYTMHAMVRAWGPSAAILLGREAALVGALAGIHDELLPDLANACGRLEIQNMHAPTCSVVCTICLSCCKFMPMGPSLPL